MASIYFDNAATTRLDEGVIAAMLSALREEYGNPSSIHSMGRSSRATIEKARKEIAALLNASTSEIFFTSGGTESNNMVLKNCVRDLGLTCIISSKVEHHCVLDTVEHLAANGLDVQYVEVDQHGYYDLLQLEQLLKEHENCKVLVSLIHANNEIGTINNIEAIGNLCRKYNALHHSDTVQTIAHYPLDFEALEIDFASCSAHKFHGPKGIGFVYISNDVNINPMIHGGGQERNMRAGTENISGIVGLATAMRIACDEMEETRQHIEGIKEYMATSLKSHFPDIIFNTPINEDSLYTVLNVTFPGELPSDMMLFNLDIAGICASAGSACSSGANQQSHVITALKKGTTGPTIRFSFSKFNTKQEVDQLIEVLKSILVESTIS